MREQTMDLRHRVIAIETAHGLITIRRVNGKRIVLELPDDLVAHSSVERAVAAARLTAKDEHGRIVPRYQFLRPKLGEQGELVGVEQPPVYKAKAS